MHLLLVTALFLEIFVGYNAQISGEFTCEDGEEYNTCRLPCETTCDNIRRRIQSNCSGPCVPGCFCRRGLVRADDRTCVAPSECIRPECQENEEYLDCGFACPLNCTNFNGPIFCTKPCYRGCFCKADFVRDSRGKCIEPRNCKLDGNIQCPANAEYVNCVNFCNTCFISEYCRTPYCTPGCDCKPGYFRDTYGQCITEEQCVAEEYALGQQCGFNEVYTSCVNPCNDCYSRGRCDDNLSNYCTPGCDCKSGFFRNDNGICIPEWNCLRPEQPVCPLGEEFYDCVPSCRVTCDTYNNADVICDTTCHKGCFCKEGFIRRGDGLCVSPSECPAKPLPCPPGETLYQCLPTCGTTCRTLNSSRGLCSTECRQGCFCQPGFVRNDNGDCVASTECPSVCGPNEEFRTCGSACPATCENFREKKICNQERCLRGCFCKTGFLLGPRGNCIRLRNCPIRDTTPFQGRRKGNETDDDDELDTLQGTNIISVVTTETPSTDSSNTSSSDATKPSGTSKKVPDKTTPKSETVTTTLKVAADMTTEIPSTMSAAGKAEPTSLIINEETAAQTNNTELAAPKSEAVTTTLKIAADTNTEIPSTTSTEGKAEPTSLTINAAETPAETNTELTALTDLVNLTTTNSTVNL